jgi:hypothetical protein
MSRQSAYKLRSRLEGKAMEALRADFANPSPSRNEAKTADLRAFRRMKRG